MKKMRKDRKPKGFTLIEVVVVMAIIAVLAVLIVGAINIARKTARETTHRSNAKALQTGIEAYYARNKTYPPSTTDPVSPNYSTDNSLSFATMADNGASHVDVKLSATPECSSGGWGDGGGQVWINTYRTEYAIEAYDASCGALLDRFTN